METDLRNKIKGPRNLLKGLIILLFLVCLIAGTIFFYHAADFISQIFLFIFLPLLVVFFLSSQYPLISGWLLLAYGFVFEFINLHYFYHVIYLDFVTIILLGIGYWLITLSISHKKTILNKGNRYYKKLFGLWGGISILLSLVTVFVLLFDSLPSYESGIFRFLFYLVYRIFYITLLFLFSFFHVFRLNMYELISSAPRKILPFVEYFTLKRSLNQTITKQDKIYISQKLSLQEGTEFEKNHNHNNLLYLFWLVGVSILIPEILAPFSHALWSLSNYSISVPGFLLFPVRNMKLDFLIGFPWMIICSKLILNDFLFAKKVDELVDLDQTGY
jgi:hypothetical protein